MAIPNGVTPDGSQSAKQDDISKLTDLLINIDKSLSTLSGISTEEEKRGKQSRAMQVSKNPTVSDLIKFTNNLGLAVPAGFIMIHNDLQKLISSESGESMWDDLGDALSGAIVGSVVALMAGGANMVKAGGEAVSNVVSTTGKAVSNVVDTAASGTVDIINAIKGTGDATLNALLADEEFIEVCKKETDIIAIRKAGIKAYLRAYYANLVVQNGYKIDNPNVDPNKGWTISETETHKGLLSRIASAGAEFITESVKGVANAVVTSIGEVQNLKDPNVTKVMALGYSNYLRAYYANMVKPLEYYVDDVNLDTWHLTWQKSGVSVAKDIATSLSQFISEPIKALIGSITDSIGTIPAAFAEDVHKARVMGYSNYLKAYYANLMKPLEYTVVDINTDPWELQYKKSGVSVANDIVKSLSSLISEPIKTLMTTITDTIGTIPAAFAGDVHKARVMGYSNYLKAYYANLMKPLEYTVVDINANPWELQYKKSGVSVVNDIVKSLSSLISEPLKTIMTTLTDTIAQIPESFSDIVHKTRGMGYASYLRAYYANLMKPLEYTPVDINANEWTLQYKKSGVSVVNDIVKSLSSLISEPLKTIMTTLTDGIADASMNGSEDVKKTRAAGYRAYLRAYYVNMLETYGYTVDIDKLNKDDFTIRKSGFGEGLVKGWINDATSTLGSSIKNVLSGVMSAIGEHIFDENLDKDASVFSTKKAGFKGVLDAMYLRMADAIDDVNDNWGSDLRGYAKNALKDAFNALGQRTSQQIKENTTVIQSSYDDSWVLDAIYGLRKVVEGVTTKLDVIIKKEPVVVNTNNGQNLPSTVNYGELAE